MHSDDKLWKPIPKPLEENEDGKYLEEATEITMDTFKEHPTITPSHNASTPLFKRNGNQGVTNNALLLHAKPYGPIPTPNNQQGGLPSTFAAPDTRNKHHSSTDTSAPIKFSSSVARDVEASLTKSTSDGSLYMKMESSHTILQQSKLYDAESAGSVSYVDYVLPVEDATEEDEYQNASAVRLATALQNKSILPPPVPTGHAVPVAAAAERKNRPPEPKPKPNKNKPRKMHSAGLINPILLPAASEELHYMCPRSAGLTTEGYKEIEFSTLDQSDYTMPVARGDSLPGHANSQHQY